MKKIQVTIWQPPDALVATAQGPIPFRLWCELERWRCVQAGRPVQVVAGPDKRIALFRPDCLCAVTKPC